MKCQYTISYGDVRVDLPKNMPIPRQGDFIFIEGTQVVVDQIEFHICGGKLHWIDVTAL